MTRVARRCALSVVLSLSACASSAAPPRAESVVAVPAAAPESTSAEGEPAGSAARAAPPPSVTPDPAAMASPPPVADPHAKLDAPCARRAVAADRLDSCGTHSTTALEVDARTISLVRSADCQPTTLVHKGMYRPLACVHEDLLFAGSLCFACRLVGAGWSVKARISELDAAQALDLQKRLGLDVSAPLGSADEWQRAIAAKQAPTP